MVTRVGTVKAQRLHAVIISYSDLQVMEVLGGSTGGFYKRFAALPASPCWVLADYLWAKLRWYDEGIGKNNRVARHKKT
ncbi:MAG: hypothetical protein LBH20_04190 [Treponema sp.]|jgi:hypothetical protein|nr:hypothetical protein [Treponema sp.]